MHRSHARGFLATFVDSGGRRATGSLWQRTWDEQQSEVDRHLSARWGLPLVLQRGRPNLRDDIGKGVSPNHICIQNIPLTLQFSIHVCYDLCAS